MNLAEKHLNILHYCFYRMHYKMHIKFKKINPFRLIHKLPFQKRRYEKLGINIEHVVDNLFGDKRFGTSVTIAGGALWSTLSFWFISTSIILNAIINKSYISTIYFWIFGGLGFAITHIFVFRKDKYLKHFRVFDKWNKNELYKNCILTIIYLIATICFFFGSLSFNGF